MSVAAALADVRGRIAAAATRVGRDPGDVTLVAVAKGQPPARIMEAYDAGHRDFGENRAEALADAAPVLPGDIRWHFVGALQRRKVRLVRPVVSLLHSLDRPQLAAAWVKGPGHPPPVLVEVNIAEEPQKHGVRPADAAGLVATCLEAGLDVQGLMAIPPVPEEAEDSRPWFTALRQLRDEIAATFPTVTQLSMGMTADFEVAIEEGATLVRVGRAIFGAATTVAGP